MKARLSFLAGGNRGRRVLLKDRVITIGGDRAALVHLRGVPAGELLAIIEKTADGYRVAAQPPHTSVTVNGVQTRETPLADGDIVRLAHGHLLRFGVVPEHRERPKAMGAIVRHSWRGARHLEGGVLRRAAFFLRDLGHCAARDASRRARVAWAVALVAVAAASATGVVSLMQARAANRRVVELSAQVAAGARWRRQAEQQLERLPALEREKARTETQIGEVARALETAGERLARLERQGSDLQAAIATARQSVALLLVGYALFEKASGRPLRFAVVDANGVPMPDPSGRYRTSVDGAGPLVVSYANGSAFLIDGGRIVTNRHLAQPWLGDDSVAAAMRRGFEPRRTVMRAYFPSLPGPVQLRPWAVSPAADVAVLQAATPIALPPLALAPPERPVSAGDLIVVVAYPTGFDALLAKAEEPVARKIQQTAGDSLLALAAALATRRLITPTVTIGHVGEVLGNNLVYDAATTHGSSGGPVLNAAGEVIALNYAGMADFAGARFGIPIRFVQHLLEGR